ncbi:hypothetical protein Dda3937_02769 [Dickeya dadantii 3937]|uniref:Uncharacterized protein n=1 Tax=Dickeya dadantii (strain 3937) TaxID=198628 RepID=E0SJG1_DICD3|nr:hypothetical protein Dda3937_02769 [Dickeya dadantii 3937]
MQNLRNFLLTFQHKSLFAQWMPFFREVCATFCSNLT